MYHFPESASFLVWLLCLPLSESNLLSSHLSDTINISSQSFIVNSTNAVLSSTTIAPGSAAGTISAEAVSADANNDLFIGNPETMTAGLVLSPPINTVFFGNNTVSTGNNTISFGNFTTSSNTTGLTIASNLQFPAGSQSTISSRGLRSSESPTSVPNSLSSKTCNITSATESLTSQGAGLGPGFGHVGSIPLSNTSHPPSIPTPGGKPAPPLSIPTPGGKPAPPGFGGPIRPPSGRGGCPSFFGVSFCPPEFPDLPAAGLPESPDPNNPGDSEHNEDNDATKSQDAQSPTLSTTQSMDTTTCSACDGCVTYDYSPATCPNPVDDDTVDLRRRKLAGRFIPNKRGDNFYSSTTTVVANTACTVSKYTNKPRYPGPGAVLNNEPPAAPGLSLEKFFQTATYWAVPTTPPDCGAPGWQFMSTNEIQDYPQPWKIGGGNGNFVNIDHVYEISLLNEFFAAQFTAGFTCEDFSKVFDVSDDAAGGSRLNTIFDQLASLTNPDFVGMDRKLNCLKGGLWNPNLRDVELPMTNANAAMRSLSRLAVVMSMANHEAISKLFANTNARIYQVFRSIDLLISATEGCSNSVDDENERLPSNTWASAYSVWITSKIASQNSMITKTASLISAAIPTDPAHPKVKAAQVGQVKNWSKFMHNFNAAFQVDALTFPQPDSWPQDAKGFEKHQAATPACTGRPSVDSSVSRAAGFLSLSLPTSLASTTDRSPSAYPSSSTTTPPGPGSPAPSPIITSAFSIEMMTCLALCGGVLLFMWLR